MDTTGLSGIGRPRGQCPDGAVEYTDNRLDEGLGSSLRAVAISSSPHIQRDLVLRGPWAQRAPEQQHE